MLQLGFFLFFNILAFGFLSLGLAKKKAIFGDILVLFGMVLFFALGFYMLPVEDIGMQVITISNVTAEQFTTTHTFIEDRETFYLIYLYWGMAMLCFVLFMLGHIKMPEHWGNKF